MAEGARGTLVPEPLRGAFPVALALVAVSGAALLALIASRAAEPLVLTVMAALATIGVFFLFALAARHVRFGRPATDADLLRNILDATDNGLQVADDKGRVLAINQSFRALVGQNRLGEVNTLEALLAGEPDGAQALFRLCRAADRGKPHREEIGTRTASGEARVLRIGVKPFDTVLPEGAPRLRLWQIEDLTADRQQQARARVSIEAELANYAGLPLGLMIAGRDGKIGYLNDRLAGWLGLGPEPRGRDLTVADLVADGGAPMLLGLMPRDDGTPLRIDLDLVSERGRRWPAALLVDAQADRIAISVLERAEEDREIKGARSSEHRFSRFFQSAPIGIAVVDGRGRILNSNTAFSRLAVDGAAQLRGASVVESLAHGDRATEKAAETALAAALEGKANIAPFDVVHGAKGKELARKVFTTSLARAGAAGEAAIFYVIDVTEEKALELRVAQGQKMEAVGTLAGGIAHDFNNVLTAIIGFSDLLLQTHRPGAPGYADIASIKSSANRAAGLVRQLLAFSRRQTLQPTVLQPGDVLTDLSMLLNRLLGEKIELKIVSGRDLWLIKADRTQLDQVMINLAVNARDAMLPGGGRLTIRTRNVSERDAHKFEPLGVVKGEYVLVEVEDTGTGITPEVMEKIFEPFFTTKAVGKGTGLGLATVYGIVKQTGGYIFADSAPGKGTTFRVLLPRHQLEADEEIDTGAAARKQRPRDLTGTGRVLLVEDEEAVRRFAVTALKSKGYEVLQAGDGVEALEVLNAKDQRIDLVVSDVMMPEMDGPTLLKEARKTNPTLKFIFVSGYPDDAFKNSIDPGAAFAFLPKPYNLAQLAAKVKEEIEL